jgi:hypothetical protein
MDLESRFSAAIVCHLKTATVNNDTLGRGLGKVWL